MRAIAACATLVFPLLASLLKLRGHEFYTPHSRHFVMRRFQCLLLFLIAGIGSAIAQQAPLGLLGPEDFLKMHQDLAKCPEEPWRSIPWRTSVLEAQRTAAVEGKPIFIWAMDGHPLGCT